MKKITLNAKAKINLTLDILGVTDGYHALKSLVTSIDLADKITIKKRRDKTVTVRMAGLPVPCELENNNAYKAAKLFMAETGVNGVDITIRKNIPVGAGLGGSSADIAGVINGMKALYGVDCDPLSIANKLGSDSGYMTKGGWAIIEGRGDKVTCFSPSRSLYLLIITDKAMVSTKDAYSAFDALGETTAPSTDKAVTALCKGDAYNFFPSLKNDLYPPVKALLPQLETAIASLKSAGAKGALMTGSGSAVYGIFTDKKERNVAYKTLKKEYGKRLIKACTDA